MRIARQRNDDPIVEEVHQVREKLSKDVLKDPRAFHERIKARALAAGYQISKLKPVSLKNDRDKTRRAKTGSEG